MLQLLSDLLHLVVLLDSESLLFLVLHFDLQILFKGSLELLLNLVLFLFQLLVHLLFDLQDALLLSFLSELVSLLRGKFLVSHELVGNTIHDFPFVRPPDNQVALIDSFLLWFPIVGLADLRSSWLHNATSSLHHCHNWL